MKQERATTSPPLRPVILYDGHCVICTSGMKRLAGLVGKRVEMVDLHQIGVLERFPGITYEMAMELPHLVEADGAIYTGLGAIMRTLAARPGLSMLRQVYELDSIQNWGEWFYRVLSESRYRFMGEEACEGACSIHLEMLTQ